MRIVREGHGLDITLRFIHNGVNAHECVITPHNMDRMITKVWRELGDDEVLYEDIPWGRSKAIRFPGRTYPHDKPKNLKK